MAFHKILLYHLAGIGRVKVISLQARHSSELIHHVTYNNIDVPGFLWLVPRTRFVWGPVGGGQVAPDRLQKSTEKAGGKNV
jgi:hypothetical protein